MGRYLASDVAYMPRDRRALTPDELRVLHAHGLAVILFWENSPDHVGSHTERRAWDGYDAGVEDAILARAMARYLGFPDDTPIYYCIDVDSTGRATEGYFQGVKHAEGNTPVGVYGGYTPVAYLFERGLVRYAVQTDAWRYGMGWYHRAQIHQYTVPGPNYAGNILGIECDGLEAITDDFGQWAGEDTDMTSEERDLLKRCRLATLSASFENAGNEMILEAIAAKIGVDLNALPELRELRARQATDVANERAKLGL